MARTVDWEVSVEGMVAVEAGAMVASEDKEEGVGLAEVVAF